MKIRIGGRVQLSQRVARAGEDARGDVPLDVTKELGVAAQTSHGRPREEHAEQQPPAPGVPGVFVEALASRAIARREKVEHASPRMDQRQHAIAKQREIALELSGAADAGRDGSGRARPRIGDLRSGSIVRQRAYSAARRDEGREPISSSSSGCASARYAATLRSRQASCAGLRSSATTRAGSRVSSASALSPAEAIETHTSSRPYVSASSSTSASSQTWA